MTISGKQVNLLYGRARNRGMVNGSAVDEKALGEVIAAAIGHVCEGPHELTTAELDKVLAAIAKWEPPPQAEAPKPKQSGPTGEYLNGDKRYEIWLIDGERCVTWCPIDDPPPGVELPRRRGDVPDESDPDVIARRQLLERARARAAEYVTESRAGDEGEDDDIPFQPI